MDPRSEDAPGEVPTARSSHRLIRWISVGEQAVGATALLAIFVLVFVQAAQRHLPVNGWPWTGELSRYCLVWLTFSVIGYLFGQGQHITLQVVDTVAPDWLLRWVRAFASLVVAAVSIGFVVEAWSLVNQHGQVTPSLQMPLELVYVIPLLGFAFTVLRALWGIFDPTVIDPATAKAGDQR